MAKPTTDLFEDITIACGDAAVSLTLTADQLTLTVNEGPHPATVGLTLTEARAIHEALGHLLWLADR